MSSNCTTKLVVANPSSRGDLDYIDTSVYRFEVVVDWISFQIETVEPTQFRYIQAHLVEGIGSKPFIEPINLETGERKTDGGGTTTVFNLKVYDQYANNYQKLAGLFALLQKKYPLITEPKITGIEIAFDAYSLSHSNDDLCGMSLWMMERLNAAKNNVRQYDPLKWIKGDNVTLSDKPELQLDPRWNLRVGNRWDDLSYQVYLKTVNRKLVIENPAKHCARSEFTLCGSTLAAEGIKSLSDLKIFDFKRLATYIRFRGLKTLDQIIAENEGKLRWIVESSYDRRAVCLTGGRGRGLRYANGKIRKSDSRKASSHTLMSKQTKDMNDRVTRNFKVLNSNFHTEKRTKN